MRSKSVILGLTLAASYGLTGCSSGDDYQGICTDPVTEERVDDDLCESGDDDSDFVWFYMGSGHSAPPIGKKFNKSHGVYKVPSGKTASKGGVSKTGGKITRGGFGSSGGKSSS